MCKRGLRTFSLSTCSSGISLIHISFLKKSYHEFFEIYQENQQKRGLKIAFYFDDNVFSLSNLTISKADISETSSERYRFLFIFVCRTSKYTHLQKIKIFYREVNYVHLALRNNQNVSGILFHCSEIPSPRSVY